MANDELKYDVALSFASEQRAYVERVYKRLDELGVRAFYDADEVVDLWGKNLFDHFDDVYRHKARFVVIFASREYAAKQWTNHERRSAQARALQEHGEYLLVARFDDTDIPGILPTVGYVDLRGFEPEQLAEMIAAKVRRSGEPPIQDANAPAPSMPWKPDPAAAGRLAQAITMIPNLDTPIFSMAVTPAALFAAGPWDDSTVDRVEQAVRLRFGDLTEATVGEVLVDFQVENARGDLLRRVWAARDGTVFRRFAWMTPMDQPIDALRVAGEMRRTWLMARQVIPAVLPGYAGLLRYRMAIGSVNGGFRSHRSMIKKLEHLQSTPVRPTPGWMYDGDIALDATDGDLLRSVLPRMLLAFGFRHAVDVVEELVAMSADSASAEDPPW
jgi:hypothetical protein